MEVQILTAKEVSIPIFPPKTDEMAPEVMQLRADFLAGKQLSREDLGNMMAQAVESGSGGGGNGNCNIC
jgi:hypothetical protein